MLPSMSVSTDPLTELTNTSAEERLAIVAGWLKAAIEGQVALRAKLELAETTLRNLVEADRGTDAQALGKAWAAVRELVRS